MRILTTLLLCGGFIAFTSCGEADTPKVDTAKIQKEIESLDSLSTKLESVEKEIKSAAGDLDAALNELNN